MKRTHHILLVVCIITFSACKNGFVEKELKTNGIARVNDRVVKIAGDCARTYIDMWMKQPARDWMVPSARNGDYVGVKIFISPDSIFNKLGLKEGDIVTSVAGIPLLGEMGVSVLGKFLRGHFLPEVVDIEIIRHNEEIVFTTIIEELESKCLAVTGGSLK